jgi:hypothetical protein
VGVQRQRRLAKVQESLNEVYDPSTDSWTEKTPISTPVSTILPVTCVEPAMLAVGAKITANYQV